MITKEIEFSLKFKFKLEGKNIKGSVAAIEGLKDGNSAWTSDIVQSVFLCNSEGPVDIDLSITLEENIKRELHR